MAQSIFIWTIVDCDGASKTITATPDGLIEALNYSLDGIAAIIRVGLA